MLLISLIFVQDLRKLSNSFKGSWIRINSLEMRSYESSKCSHPIYFNERRRRIWKLRVQWESNPRPLPLQHNNKTTI